MHSWMILEVNIFQHLGSLWIPTTRYLFMCNICVCAGMCCFVDTCRTKHDTDSMFSIFCLIKSARSNSLATQISASIWARHNILHPGRCLQLPSYIQLTFSELLDFFAICVEETKDSHD